MTNKFQLFHFYSKYKYFLLKFSLSLPRCRHRSIYCHYPLIFCCLQIYPHLRGDCTAFATIYDDGYHIVMKHFFYFFLTNIFLSVSKYIFSFGFAFFANPIHVRVSVSDFPSSVKRIPDIWNSLRVWNWHVLFEVHILDMICCCLFTVAIWGCYVLTDFI